MTLGDIIEKFLGLFGVAPGPQRKLMNKISTISTKIAEMEESRNTILRTNTAIGEKIADLKRQLQVETSPHNQDLLMDRVDEAEKELERKVQLSRQMGENTATRSRSWTASAKSPVLERARRTRTRRAPPVAPPCSALLLPLRQLLPRRPLPLHQPLPRQPLQRLPPRHPKVGRPALWPPKPLPSDECCQTGHFKNPIRKKERKPCHSEAYSRTSATSSRPRKS